ncbi:MAG TPA: glycosyltransferase family 39 protein [Acidobacteriaceae bacterium]|nr:glycosyltransferase family 39 protein [Acidobacteriaceae bacterium]
MTTADRPDTTARQFDLKAPWTIFWIALLVRIAYMTLARTWHIRPYDDEFGFGYEMGRIGRALATGYGFADPFRGHTGPTAWVPPVFPWILAGDFKVFGIYSAIAAWVVLAFDCVLNALMVRTTWEIAGRCFNRKIAFWSAWIWALYPAAMQYAVKWIWEMTLTAFLFSWVLVLALRMRGIGDAADEAAAPGVKQWAVFGLLWAGIALTNPSLLLFLPVTGVWILMGVQRWAWWRQVTAAALAGGICLACLVPWTYRNWHVFHQFVPVRANFGVELYLGNGPGATGLLMEYDHPAQAPDQLRLYRELGEIAYAKMRGAMAKRIILADPARFVNLCMRRLYYFWFSVPHPGDEGFVNEYGRNLNYQFTSIVGLLGLALALRRGIPAGWVFFWAFLTLPLTYYFVTVHARFRHPLEPLIAILGVYLFQSAEKSWDVRWFGRRR